MCVYVCVCAYMCMCVSMCVSMLRMVLLGMIWRLLSSVVIIACLPVQASKEWRVVTDFLERLSKNEASTTNSSGLVQIDEGHQHALSVSVQCLFSVSVICFLLQLSVCSVFLSSVEVISVCSQFLPSVFCWSYQCLFSVSAICFLLKSSVSVLCFCHCFHFTGVCSIFLLYVICDCVCPVFLPSILFFTIICCIFLPNAVSLPGFLSSVFSLLVSVSYFCCMLFVTVSVHCFCYLFSLCKCLFHGSAICCLLPVSVQCFYHLFSFYRCLFHVSAMCFRYSVCPGFCPVFFFVTSVYPMFLSHCYFQFSSV